MMKSMTEFPFEVLDYTETGFRYRLVADVDTTFWAEAGETVDIIFDRLGHLTQYGEGWQAELDITDKPADFATFVRAHRHAREVKRRARVLPGSDADKMLVAVSNVLRENQGWDSEQINLLCEEAIARYES